MVGLWMIFILFIFFFLAVVGLLLGLFSSCGEWGPLSSEGICWWLLLWNVGSRAQCLWLPGLVALRHMGSSQIRDWTRVSCIGRRTFFFFFFLTTEPPGKPWLWGIFIFIFTLLCIYFWGRQWQPTPILSPGKSHGRRSLVGWSPWGR